jgi:outer membrane receptor for ferric coprogen and ferric-rhodotorulic acid
MDGTSNLTGNRFDSAQDEIYDESWRTAEEIKHMVPKAGLILSGTKLNAFFAARRVSHREVANHLTGNRFDSAQDEIYDESWRTNEEIKHMVPKAGLILSGTKLNAFFAARRASTMEGASHLTGNRFDSAQVEIYDESCRSAEVKMHMVPKAGIEPALP